MDKNKFSDVLKAVCQIPTGLYVAPFMNISKPLPQDPVFAEVDFDIFIHEVYEQATKQSPGIQDKEIMLETLREILFDGVGYFVPCLGTYINALPQNQQPNRKIKASGVWCDYYDFSQDPHFNKFLSQLWENSDNIFAWLNKVKSIGNNRILDFVGEMNTNYAGRLKIAAPIIERLEKLEKKSEG